MKVTKEDWNNFWKLMKHTKNDKISLLDGGWMYITFNPSTQKIEFLNSATGKKGTLTQDDFKKLFGKHVEFLHPYIHGDKRIPDVFTKEMYVACIFRRRLKLKNDSTR